MNKKEKQKKGREADSVAEGLSLAKRREWFRSLVSRKGQLETHHNTVFLAPHTQTKKAACVARLQGCRKLLLSPAWPVHNQPQQVTDWSSCG